MVLMRILALVSVLVLVWACSESSSPRESEEVTVDSFNVALAGAFIPFEAERRQPIVDAIAAADADILCLQEVWEQSDKDLVKAGATDNYPHVVSDRSERRDTRGARGRPMPGRRAG
jgi:hypothetical protein